MPPDHADNPLKKLLDMRKLLFYLKYGPRMLLVYLRNRAGRRPLQLHGMTVQRTMRGRMSRARLKWAVSGCHRIEVEGHTYPGTVQSVSILEHAQARTAKIVFHGADRSITVPVQLAASVTPLLEDAAKSMRSLASRGIRQRGIPAAQATVFDQRSLQVLAGKPVPVRFAMPQSSRLQALSLNLQSAFPTLKIHL
jgi:hypothetical protein